MLRKNTGVPFFCASNLFYITDIVRTNDLDNIERICASINNIGWDFVSPFLIGDYGGERSYVWDGNHRLRILNQKLTNARVEWILCEVVHLEKGVLYIYCKK